MPAIEERDDPLYKYILVSRLQPYIPRIREWWAHVTDLKVISTGVYGIADAPPGLMYRFTKSAKKSPIPGIQTFPFVATAFLQISGIPGGAIKMIDYLCRDNKLQVEEFQVIAKNNLPSVVNAGQILVFIPTDLYHDPRCIGQWVYLTDVEIMYLSVGHVTKTIQDKMKLRIV